MIVELARQRGRDIFGTDQYMEELCGTKKFQLRERSAHGDLEEYVTCRDSYCIMQLLSHPSDKLQCVVCEEFSANADNLNITTLGKYPAQKNTGSVYHKLSEMEHNMPVRCHGTTTPSNITQMCKLCHSRKSHLEESIGTGVLQKFFDSFAAVAEQVFFDNTGMTKLLSNSIFLVSDDCLQLVRQHDHNVATGLGMQSYFPTQCSVKKLCTQKYFTDYYKRYGWCLMASAERHDTSRLDRLRRITSCEDLVHLFSVEQGSASSGSRPPKRKAENMVAS